MISSHSIERTAGLTLAVIGLGRMGMRHVQAAKNLGMKVCGLVDVSQQSLDAACVAQGIDPGACFTDAAVMLEAVKPQALVVATTAPSHAQYVLAAAAAGVRHILCEKPMAVSLAEADAMLRACRDAGAQLAVNHQMRYMPQYTQVKALIDSPDLGPLSSIIVAGSNFGLAMNASHYFEMFRYITDGPVASIQAWFEDGMLPNPRGAQFEDRSGRLLARSDAGPTMFMDFSQQAGHGQQVVYICRFGQILVDELTGDMRVGARKSEFRDLPTTRYAMPAETRQVAIDPVDAVAPTMQVWSALRGDQPFPDGPAGLHALTCLVAAHASHDAGGRPVRLDDPALPRERRFQWA